MDKYGFPINLHPAEDDSPAGVYARVWYYYLQILVIRTKNGLMMS
jgi:hypothetical protein